MVTTDEAKTETPPTDNGTDKKARKRIDPKLKMVKALYSILGEQLRDNQLEEAGNTLNDMGEYLGALVND